MSARWRGAILLAAVIASPDCGRAPQPTRPAPAAPAAPRAADPPTSSVTAIGTLPHDRTAFTEGLAFWRGRLFESSGLYGQSILRELDPRSGRALRQAALAATYFGEGITILNGSLYQLTWREHTCLVYDAASFQPRRELAYDGEGWGMTNDGTSLVTSDGSAYLRYRDPASFRVTRTLRVTSAGRPVENLNELEYIHGEIWANVWPTSTIVRISPADGHVIAALDAARLVETALRSGNPDDVLNGIAFDPASGTLLVTGKRWPTIYQLAPPR
jgi:glutamine cyclotransferase